MKKLTFVLLIAMIAQSLFAGAAGAAYVQEADKKISINTGLNLLLPANTGKLTFDLQEAVHNKVTGATGVEVDHFYFWVEVDGQSVLAVDPARVMF